MVGKRVGVHRWSPTTMKTVEGSLVFVGSIVLSAWALRLAGLVESFSVCFWPGENKLKLMTGTQTVRYLTGVVVSALLEALSNQNDNLTLPLYMWSALVLANP